MLNKRVEKNDQQFRYGEKLSQRLKKLEARGRKKKG